jgi:hypothetical protein
MYQTSSQNPPMKQSDEANQKQLELAQEQGSAFKNAIKAMKREADTAMEKTASDYMVAIAIEKAEGMYHLENNQLVWQNPTDQNAHIEVVVCDGADGRFVPGLQVTVAVTDQNGKEIGRHEQPYLWHPWLYHYGRNWVLPGDGSYHITVHIEAPEFARHDKKNGLRYAKPVDVNFENVQVKTGQKLE